MESVVVVIDKEKQTPSTSIPTKSDEAEKCGGKLKDAVPVFDGYQLLGDSIFVRFAKNCLNIPSTTNSNGSATVGYCVSGQRIKQLTKQIRTSEFKLKSKVVIHIGTNDMLCGRNLEEMKYDFEQLITLLRLRLVRKFLILTLPPIAKYALMENHWRIVQGFNQYLRELCKESSKFYIVDTFPLFLKQESPVLNPPLKPCNHRDSPKRKAERSLSYDTRKKKIAHRSLLTEDKGLSQFCKYINKVNRREFENDLVSSDDEGYHPSLTPYIDYIFWNQLKPTIILTEDKNEDEQKETKRNSLTPVSPTSPSQDRNNRFQDVLLEIKAIAQHFIRLDYYETYFYNGRIDMVHPNTRSLEKMKNAISKCFKSGRCSYSM